MSSLDKERDSVIANLKACVISAQGGVPTCNLNDDYYQIIGERIPFKRLGYKNLEDFLRSIPDIVLTVKSGVTLIEARVSSETSHISQLVQRQKRSGSRRRPKAPLPLNRFNLPKSSRLRTNQRAPVRPPSQSWQHLQTLVKPKQPRKQNHFPTSLLLSNLPDRCLTEEDIWSKYCHFDPLFSETHFFPISRSSPLSSASRSSDKTDVKSLKRVVIDDQPNESRRPALLPTPPKELLISNSGSNNNNNYRPALLPIPSSKSDNFYSRPLFPQEEQRSLPQHPVKVIPTSPFASFHSRSTVAMDTSVDEIHTENGLDQNRNNNVVDLMSMKMTNVKPVKKVKQSVQNRLDVKRHDRERVQRKPNTVSLGHQFRVTIDEQKGEKDAQFQNNLYMYFLTKNFPEPNYTVFKRKASLKGSGKTKYACILRINVPRRSKSLPYDTIECNTFPNDFLDPVEAKENVAKVALQKLKELEHYETLPVTNDKGEILRRIEHLVKDKIHGLWANKIEDCYRLLYNELLPESWLEFVSKSGFFLIEHLANNSFIVREKEAVFFKDSSLGMVMPALPLPNETNWDVFVTKAVSTDKVWIRFIGDAYSVMFDALVTEMESWFGQKERLLAPVLILGEHYAAYCDDCWARVTVLEVEAEKIHVRFIDHGDEDVIPRSTLYKLDPRFLKLPAQAMLISLKGLEACQTRKDAADFLRKNIVGKSVVGVVEDQSSSIPVLTLYDTSNEEAVSLNELLKSQFEVHYWTAVTLQAGRAHEVFLSRIEECGNVYVQVQSESLSLLYELIDLIDDETFENVCMKDSYDLILNKNYLLSKNNAYCRARVINRKNIDGKVEVNLIDIGGRESVFIEDLYNLEEISYLLDRIADQAVLIHLNDLLPGTFTRATKTKLEDMVPATQSLLAKVTQDGQIPVVELFKRISSSNAIISVNQSIALAPDLSIKKVTQNLKQLDLKPSRRENAIIGAVTKNFKDGSIERLIAQHWPPMPNIGDQFEVYVADIANPGHFMIQLMDYIYEQNALLSDMKIYYNERPELKMPLREGELCVIKVTDDFWHRGYIEKIIDSESASTRLLDYAILNVAQTYNIKPLVNKFKDSVPFIGFNAKLYGVVPKHGDWSVENCLYLRNLIYRKKLYAILKEVEFNPTSLCGLTLSLEMFDTSNEKINVDIARYFVEEGHALFHNTM